MYTQCSLTTEILLLLNTASKHDTYQTCQTKKNLITQFFHHADARIHKLAGLPIKLNLIIRQGYRRSAHTQASVIAVNKKKIKIKQASPIFLAVLLLCRAKISMSSNSGVHTHITSICPTNYPNFTLCYKTRMAENRYHHRHNHYRSGAQIIYARLTTLTGTLGGHVGQQS